MKESELECSRCGGSKPESQFYKRLKSARGYSVWCKPCHKEYDRERYRNLDKHRKSANRRSYYEQNLDFIVKYLRDHPCILCGEDALVVLDFDHRDETTKSHNVSEMLWTHSIANIQREIDKCDVLCSNCHRKRTSIQFGWRKALLADK